MLTRLKSWLERTAAPGVSIAVDDGHSILCFNEGVSDLRTNLSVCNDTAFQLGSVSKVITAFVLLETLAEKGLSVDTPVVALAPDLKASNEAAFHDITVRHLLCHTSGLDSQWWADFGRGDCARRSAARAIAATPLIARPGELFSYSGPAYILAGYLTEVLNGGCWEEHTRAAVARYLGDHSISARPEDILLRPSAAGYIERAKAGGKPTPVARWYAPLALSPGGGLVGTTADVARLMRAVRERLGLNSVSDDNAPRFVAPTIGWRYEGWGLGLARYRLPGGNICWGHDGTTSGQACAVRFCEGRPETVVVAANAAWAASEVSKLAEAIIGMFSSPPVHRHAATRRDALAGYDSWHLPPDQDVSGSYARLNSTTLVQPLSDNELAAEEIFSPQDEANWFGRKEPRETNVVKNTLRRVKKYSYKSTGKELHFLRHPADPARIYMHNGMRASVKVHRPWI